MAETDSELLWAVKTGDVEAVKSHLLKDEDVNKKFKGRNLLHYAADFGQVEVIDFLLSKNADINSEDDYGVSVLLAAIYEGHTQCVKFLIEKGACTNGKTASGDSYIDASPNDDIKELLKS